MDAAADALEPTAWETTIEELALAGFAGHNGFGVEICSFLPPDLIDGVSVEEMDYGSVRERLEHILGFNPRKAFGAL